jgi:alkylation response protein AidB-like acyl-CoA dehydrogenase
VIDAVVDYATMTADERAQAAMAEPVLYAALHIGAVATGIARRALNEIVALAKTNKRRLYAQASLADSQLFQFTIGNAETSWRAARALLMDEAQRVWDISVGGQVATLADRARVMSAVTWAARTAAQVTDACYTAGGGTSPYDTSPLQRCMRDIHTLSQHAAVAESWLSGAGSSLLGRDSGFAI